MGVGGPAFSVCGVGVGRSGRCTVFLENYLRMGGGG